MASAFYMLLYFILFVIFARFSTAKHCIYRFRVPATGMDVTCPGAKQQIDDTGDDDGVQDIYEEHSPNTIAYSANHRQIYNSEVNNNQKKTNKKSAKLLKTGNKRSNKKRRSHASHEYYDNQFAPEAVRGDYLAAEQGRPDTLRRTPDGGAVMDGDTAQQLLQGMAKLVHQREGAEVVQEANLKMAELENSILDQNKKYEELLVKTLQLSSQMHLLTSGIEHRGPPQPQEMREMADDQPALDIGPFTNYIGATSKLGCPVNHPQRIHKITLVKQIYDQTIDVVPRSCYEWYAQGFTDSGQYKIDLDGLEGLPPVTVTCLMGGPGGPVTAVPHNYTEARTGVNGYEQPGSYTASIKYNISDSQLNYLISHSHKCEQHLKYECKGASIMFQSWWESWQGTKMTYWPGGNPRVGGCECYLDDRCSLGRQCNCDANDVSRWLEDSGFVHDKESLPISRLLFGDTGGKDEEGYFTLGPLRCYLNDSNPVTDVNAYLAITTWPPISVYCDHDGWILLQRKHADGRLGFDRSWDHYKDGFGDLKHEFWLGLDNIYKLTNQKWQPMLLQIVIELNNNVKLYATYEHFRLDDDSKNYTIHVGKYTGSMKDELKFANGMQFTAKDSDNDRYTYGNCAAVGGGGWWYTACGKVHLNGYIMWGDIEDAKTVHMKIRPMAGL